MTAAASMSREPRTPKERVAVYVDGFNLYHALDDLQRPHLKWLNLRKLADLLISRQSQRIVKVCYFTAAPDHFQNTGSVDKLLRHRAYTTALAAKGVIVVPGSFALRHRIYRGRNHRVVCQHHEEKKTDVALAVHLLNDAWCDVYDRALVICVDTDQTPASAMVQTHFPDKAVICVSPPERSHHGEIKAVTSGLGRIRVSQVEKALFGAVVRHGGAVVARRPASYRPPAPGARSVRRKVISSHPIPF